MHTELSGQHRNGRKTYFLMLLSVLALALVLVVLEAHASRPHWTAGPPGQTVADAELTGEELYLKACAACHAPSGKGHPQERLGFDIPPANFTDCNFAVREADLDWGYVTQTSATAKPPEAANGCLVQQPRMQESKKGLETQRRRTLAHPPKASGRRPKGQGKFPFFP